MLFPPGTLPLIDGPHAYLICPAEVVVGGAVTEHHWSRRARRVVARTVRQRAGKVVSELVLGGPDIPTVKLAAQVDDQVLAVGDDGTVVVSGLVDTAKESRAVFLVTTAKRTPIMTMGKESEPFVMAHYRPTDNRLFLTGATWVADATSPERRVDLGSEGIYGFDDMGRLRLVRKRKFYARDLATGREKEIDRETVLLGLSGGDVLETHEDKGERLFLQRADERRDPLARVLVAQGVDAIQVNGEANVAYIVGGALLYRPIVKTDLKTAEALASEIDRIAKVNQAKQVGLGFMLAASDHDDVFPGADWYDAVMPYVKDRAVLEGFVRTFEGRDLKNVKDPANTPLGFISGRGGRAIVYVDTSVKWEPIKR